MNNLSKEIRSNVENKNYLSALALTLILPDICGKISYPNISGSGRRYKCWYDEYIYPSELSPVENNPYNEWVPDGHIIYKLRCNLLHDGSLDINKDVKSHKKIEATSHYQFKLNNNVTSYNLSWENNDQSQVPNVLVRIGVTDFCSKICAVVDFFYCNSEKRSLYNNAVAEATFQTTKTEFVRNCFLLANRSLNYLIM